MSQDVVADGLSIIRNANKARKNSVEIKRVSNLLIEILRIMKQKNAIKKYKIDIKKNSAEVTIGDLTDCKAIKPRFTCSVKDIEKYKRRYLPARNIGTMIVSTNKGLKIHEEAETEGLGGSLIAYFY